MDQDLIDAHGQIPQLMPFLHLPVQSGSDALLKTMNRKHTAKDYLDIIDRLRKARPDIAFSSDFIIGFPKETQQDHQATLDLVRQVDFAQAYSFKYSVRPGTPAGSMDGQVAETLKTERLYEIQDLLKEQQWAFNKTKVGTVQSVLFDRIGKVPGQILGKTPYMQSVPLEAPKRLLGCLTDVLIKEAYANSMMGIILDSLESISVAA
jgi:tRNA-2-methylthio-N6-dimethylallyladenosine synthase